MLIALKLLLRSDSSVILPRDLGRACYAESLAHLGRYDARLSSYIHSLNGVKPITCSSLIGDKASSTETRIAPETIYSVRITGIEAAVSAALLECLVKSPPATWRLHNHTFSVQSVIADENVDSWTGITSYEELAASPLLQSGSIPNSMTLAFASPIAFRSNEMNIPLPLPDLVLGNLVERWNAFSPITLSQEIRDFGKEMVAISRYRLESQPFAHKNGAMRIGGIGKATYLALGGDDYWLGVMQILAHFAKYSGVGTQTTSGMGQTCKVAPWVG